MVLHLRAPKGKVSVEVMLNRAKYFDRTGKVNDHTIYLSGNLGKNALEFAMCLSAKATGGRVYTMGHTLVIEEAEKITEKLERAMAQSREHKIILLPALPKAWDHGSERPAAGWKCIDCTCVGEWKTDTVCGYGGSGV